MRTITSIESWILESSQIGLLGLASNKTDDPDQPIEPRKLETVLNVVTSSPHDGSIRIQMKPTRDAKVGDAIKLRASLVGQGKELDQIFLVKIAEPERKTKEPKKGDQPDTKLGLPKLVMVYKDASRGEPTWGQLEDASIAMNHEVVVHPFCRR